MALTTYTYSIANDFPPTGVEISALQNEIQLSAITIAIDGITSDDVDVNITFKDSLPAGDKTLLDGDISNPAGGLIAAHTAEDLPGEGTFDDDGVQLVRLQRDLSIGLPPVTVVDAPESATDLMKSWQIVIPPTTTAILDIGIIGDLVGPKGYCYLIGGEYRCRDYADEGSALHFYLVDRDDVSGAFTPYGLDRTQLTGLTNISGTISVGDYVYGDTSEAVSQVLAINGSDIEITFASGFDEGGPISWSDGEDITFKDSDGNTTATATMTAWVEGDFFEIKNHVRDEWIEGKDERQIRPGGSKIVPKGYYFRIKGYNKSVISNLRIKISLTVAIE